MATSTFAKLLPNISDICQQILSSPPSSGAGKFWFFVTSVWSRYLLWIVIGLVIWIVFELVTRGAGIHFDSDNGFSPTFNRVVGSGMYLLFQAIAFFLLKTIFGSGIYCTPLPYAIHPIVFGLTWLFLFSIGFWVY